MAERIPGINFTGPVVPNLDSDTYPSHYAKYGKGGWREVATIADRDAISAPRREEGMAVFVTSEAKLYILNEDLETWSEFKSGSTDSIRKTDNFDTFEPLFDGEIVQYIGEDESDYESYVQGYFYKATLMEESGEEPYYVYTQIDVQPATDLVWGNITGTLSEQTDLQEALDEKIRKVSDFTDYVPTDGEIVEYVGSTTASYINGYFYQASASSINIDNHEDPDITLTIIDQDKFDSWLIDLKTTYGDFDYIKITANGGPMRLVYCSADLETPVLIPGQEEPGPYYGGGLGVVGLQFVGNYYASTSGTSLYIRLGGTFEWKQKDVQPASPVVDTLESTSTTDALSANQGHVLKGMIDSIGRYIDNWNCETGLPYTLQSPYTYKQGDRFLVTNAIVPQPSTATISQTQGSGITDLSVDVSTIETFLDLKEDENILFWYTDYLAVKTSSAIGSDAMIKVVDSSKFDAWFQEQSQIPSELPEYPDFYGLQFYTYSAGRTDPETGGNVNCNWLYLYRLYYNQDHSRLQNVTIDQPYAPVSEGLAGINAILAENYGFVLRGNNVPFESIIGGNPHDNFTMTKSGVNAWTYCLTDVTSFSDYGISFDGTSAADDILTVVYTAPTYNYRPNGNIYTGEASTTVETGEVAAGDEYVYTGSSWLLQSNTQKTISFAALTGDPYDNANLTTALDAKQDTLTAGTGIDISTDTSTGKLVISSTSSESFYRGTFATWTLVPTNPTSYVEDPVHHLKTPTNTDYMIVTDASDYYKPGAEITIQARGYVGGVGYVLDISGKWDAHLTAYDTPYERVYGNNELIVKFESNSYWGWRVIFNTPVVLNGIRYDNYDEWTIGQNAWTRVFNEIVDQPCEGTWRFGYYGEWDTAGRNGWVAEYKIEDTLPIATDTVAGIAKLYTTTGSNTDGTMDQNSITTELGQRVLQVTEVPEASEELLGKIIQFIGTTGQDYTHGYFYEAKVSGDPSSIECTGTDSSTLYPYHVTIDKDTFETQITTAGEYKFSYNGTDWTLNNNVVSLDDYGISIQEGITYSSGDNMYIQYTESTIGYFWSPIPVQTSTVFRRIVEE